MWDKLDRSTKENLGALAVTAAWMVLAHFSSEPEMFWYAGIFYALFLISLRLDR